MTLARSTLVLAALLAAGAAQADDQTVLKAAAREPGAVVLQDGVVVRSMKDGKGPAPGAADVVRVQYRGTLTTGQEFDSSYSHGGPITFPLNRVIPCWTEGVQKMHVGGKAKLTCPSATAYGPRGAGGVIPPDATLVFEVELVGIQGK